MLKFHLMHQIHLNNISNDPNWYYLNLLVLTQQLWMKSKFWHGMWGHYIEFDTRHEIISKYKINWDKALLWKIKQKYSKYSVWRWDEFKSWHLNGDCKKCQIQKWEPRHWKMPHWNKKRGTKKWGENFVISISW